MADARDRDYAELIVDGCLGVQPEWQVLVGGNPQARPLLEEICAVLARRGAYALLRISFEGFLISAPSWLAEASLELLSTPAPLFVHEIETTTHGGSPGSTQSGSASSRGRAALR
jgi:hypothetical protein